MRCIRLTVATACLVLGARASLAGERLQPDRTRVVAADRWELVKLAVARESVASHLRFFRSLQWWIRDDPGRPAPNPGDLVAMGTDALAEIAVPASPVVHVRGSLATTLRVDGQSEIVIGGDVRKDGRIEAEGIAVVHVQGNVDGTIACSGMAAVWVGGDLRGEVLTGMPSMHLHVKGDLLGSVRPISRPALLYVDAEGDAPSNVLAATDRYRYTELQIAARESDLAPGIHRLWTGANGFVAVAGPVAER